MEDGAGESVVVIYDAYVEGIDLFKINRDFNISCTYLMEDEILSFKTSDVREIHNTFLDNILYELEQEPNIVELLE